MESAPSSAGQQDHPLTKHQAKVINGIRHELDRLQSKPIDTKEQGRKLRSQEATRFKSELSAYFPDYDEVIGNEPKEEHLLNPDTPIVVVDSRLWRVLPEPYRPVANQPHQYGPVIDNSSNNFQFPVRGYRDALFTDVVDSQRIDFGFLEAQHKTNSSSAAEDPLPDSVFEPIHKRAERVERLIRNTEKGRAQHEKDQIIRLLDGLQGHDWLRIMGVSGVTETKKKAFEPARMHFIRGCQFILGKFRNWSVEEKRRKLEKERALAVGSATNDDDYEDDEDVEEEEEEEEEDSDEGERGTTRNRNRNRISRRRSTRDRHGTDDSASSRELQDSEAEEMDVGEISQDDTSEASSPAKQLHREARARSKMAATGSSSSSSTSNAHKKSRRHHADHSLLQQLHKPPEPPREFKSFFSKQYERDGALHRHRRAGRKVLAWGHPIPDIPESDFVLPEEYRDEDTLKARARKKRRVRRESRQL
ncbi:hypothetical protein ESCO_005110 [Escovopsis weberi]|uniref:Something about silencing protein 4 domain-containing protein n=1 Tax=Escovopsis weberi TaxID=150374 RepID=A0A0M8N289_ESCWE|nr:hypothetical protein ESCO_005110 [Escovopsis weberi]